MTLFSKKKKNKNRKIKGISFSVNADIKSNKKGSFRKIIFLTLFLLGIYLSFSFLNQKITDVFFEAYGGEHVSTTCPRIFAN